MKHLLDFQNIQKKEMEKLRNLPDSNFGERVKGVTD